MFLLAHNLCHKDMPCFARIHKTVFFSASVKLSVTSKYNRLELQELAAVKERLFFT